MDVSDSEQESYLDAILTGTTGWKCLKGGSTRRQGSKYSANHQQASESSRAKYTTSEPQSTGESIVNTIGQCLFMQSEFSSEEMPAQLLHLHRQALVSETKLLALRLGRLAVRIRFHLANIERMQNSSHLSNNEAPTPFLVGGTGDSKHRDSLAHRHRHASKKMTWPSAAESEQQLRKLQSVYFKFFMHLCFRVMRSFTNLARFRDKTVHSLIERRRKFTMVAPFENWRSLCLVSSEAVRLGCDYREILRVKNVRSILLAWRQYASLSAQLYWRQKLVTARHRCAILSAVFQRWLLMRVETAIDQVSQNLAEEYIWHKQRQRAFANWKESARHLAHQKRALLNLCRVVRHRFHPGDACWRKQCQQSVAPLRNALTKEHATRERLKSKLCSVLGPVPIHQGSEKSIQTCRGVVDPQLATPYMPSHYMPPPQANSTCLIEDQLLTCYEELRESLEALAAADNEDEELRVGIEKLEEEYENLASVSSEAQAAHESLKCACEDALNAERSIERALNASHNTCEEVQKCLAQFSYEFENGREELERTKQGLAVSEESAASIADEIRGLMVRITGVTKQLQRSYHKDPAAEAKLKDTAAALHQKKADLQGVQQSIAQYQTSKHLMEQELENIGMKLLQAQRNCVEAESIHCELLQKFHVAQEKRMEAEHAASSALACLSDGRRRMQHTLAQLEIAQSKRKYCLAHIVRFSHEKDAIEKKVKGLEVQYASSFDAHAEQEANRSWREEMSADTSPILIKASSYLQYAMSDNESTTDDETGGRRENEEERSFQPAVSTHLASITSTPATSPRKVLVYTVPRTTMDAAAIRSRSKLLGNAFTSLKLSCMRSAAAWCEADTLVMKRCALPMIQNWRRETQAQKEWVSELSNSSSIRLCLRMWRHHVQQKQRMIAQKQAVRNSTARRIQLGVLMYLQRCVHQSRQQEMLLTIFLKSRKSKLFAAWKRHVFRQVTLRNLSASLTAQLDRHCLQRHWEEWRAAIHKRKLLRRVLQNAISLAAEQLGSRKLEIEFDLLQSIFKYWRIVAVATRGKRQQSLLSERVHASLPQETDLKQEDIFMNEMNDLQDLAAAWQASAAFWRERHAALTGF